MGLVPDLKTRFVDGKKKVWTCLNKTRRVLRSGTSPIGCGSKFCGKPRYFYVRSSHGDPIGDPFDDFWPVPKKSVEVCPNSPRLGLKLGNSGFKLGKLGFEDSGRILALRPNLRNPVFKVRNPMPFSGRDGPKARSVAILAQVSAQDWFNHAGW